MQVGDVIDGKYELVRLIGQGGMGEVFEARHLRIGRRLAVKLLHRHLDENEELVARFVREAQAAAAIGSDHIVEVTDAGETKDGAPYLVMEYLEGESLSALVKRQGPLDPKKAAELVLQICEGLAAAHDRGIIHRDLKPENLLLVRRPDGSEQVKVLDFGVAKFRETLTDESQELTGSGTTLGTPYYMAPEQAFGSKNVDARADVYATGVILYELVTGERPFKAGSYNELIVMVATSDPSPPRKLRPDLSEAVEAVILKAMAHDPDKRYASMVELARALEPLLDQPLASRSWIDRAAESRPSDPALARTAPASPQPLREPDVGDDQGDKEDESDEDLIESGLGARRISWAWLLGSALILVVATVGLAMYLRPPGGGGVDGTDPRPPILIGPDAWSEEDTGPRLVLMDAGTIPAPADAGVELDAGPDASAPCPPAKVRNADTWGNCCWPAQVWSKSQGSCIGEPECRGGTTWRGGACVCPEGQQISLDTQDNCCWPGQAWSMTRELCVGPPSCPLGFRQLDDDACEPDPGTALGRLTTACQGGDAVSCVALGEAYGDGRPEERAHASILFAQACEEGESRGCLLLGRTLSEGRSVPRDLTGASEAFLTACTGGSAEGCTALGAAKLQGIGGNKAPAAAADLFRKGCEGRDPAGCARLGELHLEGSGVDRDHQRAAELFRMACDQGLADGCGLLGEAYERGQGVPRDPERGVQLLRQACDAESMRGCRRLGLAYRHARGVKQDYDQSSHFSRRACDLGLAEGCRDLGLLYQKGLGVAQDFAAAAELYLKACDGGDAFGCRNLAIRYIRGEGVPLDHGEAANFYLRACRAGDALACGLVGDQYLTGSGVASDTGRGRALLEQGCRGGNAWSCERLEALRKLRREP
jgi:serine/threonine protein kinase/TPR repeat protein